MFAPNLTDLNGPTGEAQLPKVDPEFADALDFPSLSVWHLKELRHGGRVVKSMPLMPETRRCQDLTWAVLFLMTVALTLGVAYSHLDAVNSSAIDDEMDEEGLTEKQTHVKLLAKYLWTVVLAGVVGAGASLVYAFVFLILASSSATCVVYTALYGVSAMMVVCGLSLMFVGASSISSAALDSDKYFTLIGGAFLTAFGFRYFLLVRYGWQQYIPFTIVMVETVAIIADDQPCMIVVSMLGSLLSICWSAVVFIAMIGVQLRSQDAFANQADFVTAVILCAVLLLLWGGGIITNICHTVYCGLFGRWYFGHDDGPMLLPSIQAATATSFGSICLGSLLVASVRVVQYLAREAEEQAKSQCNPVLGILWYILMTVFSCMVACIGDILEYFNHWAYVQRAIRGASFCQAARITFSMVTCANIKYIISDMMIVSVVSMGALFCWLVGASVGAVVGFICSQGAEASDAYFVCYYCALMGSVGGHSAGASALSIVGSGVQTLLVCWAEDSQPLQDSRPEIHDMLCDKLRRAGAR
ncbi:unnamed protein product [Polarella glacialis]|uniref:Choline transporter-like protein n=1 Tax=Polarella glacialis TaxID=89957 RepID=A0A813KUN1_POLGL|nr:unnamed protein product [Polarella glacialis]